MRSMLYAALTACALVSVHAFADEYTTFITGGMYRLKADTTVKVLVNGNLNQPNAAQPGERVVLDQDSEFQVEGTVYDPFWGYIVHLNIDSDPDSDVPSDFWVSILDLQNAQLEFHAFTKKKNGMTYCYRDVKNKAMKLGVCPHYCSGSEAWMGYRIMQRECGMKPVKYSTALPIGAVCFSTGQRMCGKRKCGHVMIKVARNRWFGAGTRKVPWVGQPTGCLKK